MKEQCETGTCAIAAFVSKRQQYGDAYVAIAERAKNTSINATVIRNAQMEAKRYADEQDAFISMYKCSGCTANTDFDPLV